MSEANRVRTSYIPESTWGTTPTSGTLQVIRRTGGSLDFEMDQTRSQEVRSDRMLAQYIRTGTRASATVDFEISLGGTFDALFEGAAANTASTDVGVSADTGISATGTTNLFTDTGAGSAFANVQVGQTIRVTGFTTNAVNNGLHKVTAKADANTITVSTALVTEAAGDPITVEGQFLAFPGTTAKSFTLEQAFLDEAEYHVGTGMRVESLELSAQVGEVMTGSFSFLGKTVTVSGASLVAGSVTLGNATTTEVLNSLDNITGILENGTAFTLRGFTINHVNNLQEIANMAVGPQLSGVNYGSAEATGTISLYYDDRTIYEKLLNFTTTSLRLVFFDGADAGEDGNVLVLDLPKVKFLSGNPDAGGLDDQVMLDLDFGCFLDTVSSSMWNMSLISA